MKVPILARENIGFSMMRKVYSVDKYYKAKSIFESSNINYEYKSGVSEEFITKLEARLAVKLPSSYKMFLRDYGFLGVEGLEFYGEWERDRIGGGIPSFVWATESSRERGEIGHQEIRVMASGYGPNFVIDCSEKDDDGESPVYLVSVSVDENTGEISYNRKKVADSFGEFFLSEIQGIVL